MTRVEIFWMVRAQTWICWEVISRASAFTRGVFLYAAYAPSTTAISGGICQGHHGEILDDRGQVLVS